MDSSRLYERVEGLNDSGFLPLIARSLTILFPLKCLCISLAFSSLTGIKPF